VLRTAHTRALLAALILAGGEVRAEEPPVVDPARLAKLLADGSEAAQAKRWDACIDAYAAAAQIEKTPERLGERGLCEEAHGKRNVDAYVHLHAALNAPGIDRKIDPYKGYAAALVRVAMRVAEVYLAVNPPHAAVIVDGRPLGKYDGRTVILEPGKHTFAARLKGYKDDIVTRDLAAAQNTTVPLKLEPEQAPSAAASTSQSVTSWLFARPERIALAATTGVAALTAVASGAAAIGLEVDRGSYGNKLSPTSCFSGYPSRPPECATAHERAEQRDTAVDVTIGAVIATGVAAAITGTLFAVDRHGPHPSIAPIASNNGGGIVILGKF
jgi:hypothetical protein